MQKFMDKEIATLLKLGFIEPSSSSWRSPALLVKKPNGDFRLVVNRGVTIHRYIDISYRMGQRYAYCIVGACIDTHDIP